MDNCVICGEELKNYEPEYCCDGRECGCMGSPIEPPVCSKQECLDKVFGPSESTCASQLRKANVDKN